MRVVFASLFLFGLASSALAHDSNAQPMEKIKTGILPSGGFYSIYHVACLDETLASIASKQRGRRWCTTDQGELNCFSRLSSAQRIACSTDNLAEREQPVDRSESS